MKARSILILLIITFIFSMFWLGDFATIKSIENLEGVPLQIVGMEQYLNEKRIKTEWGESLLSYGNLKSTQIVNFSDVVEIKNISISNKSNRDVHLILDCPIEDASITHGYEKLENPIRIPAGSIFCPIEIRFQYQGSSYGNLTERTCLELKVSDSDGNLLDNQNVTRITYFEKYEITPYENDIFNQDAVWTGLSGISSKDAFPKHDMNVSTSADFSSKNSEMRRNIAVGGDRIHVAWIETEDNKLRNVFYSYADLPINKHNRWSKPINVSSFTTQQIQAESVVIAACGDMVSIIWNVEVNKGDETLETESRDDHHVFCVVGYVGKEGCWFTLSNDFGQTEYDSPKSVAEIKAHPANISKNGKYDTWKPDVGIDAFGRIHVVWENTCLAKFEKFRKHYNKTIMWIFWQDGWKTVSPENKEEIVEYIFEESGETNGYFIVDEFIQYKSLSLIVTKKMPNIPHLCTNYEVPDRVYISFTSSKDDGHTFVWELKNGCFISHNVFTSPNHLLSASVYEPKCKFFYVYELDGNIYTNYGFTDKSGKCKNPMMMVAHHYDRGIHLVYEKEGEIFYWAAGKVKLDSPVRISGNVGYSYSPSIALDENYRIHVVWTNQLKNHEPEIVYQTLSVGN